MKNIFSILFVVFFVSFSFGQTEEKKNFVTAGVACGNNYHGMDVGGEFFTRSTCKGWGGYGRKIGKKTTAYVGVWGQRAIDAPSPNGADEGDIEASVSYQATKKTSVTGYVANFYVPGLRITKYAGTVAKDFKVGKVPVTVSNDFIGYTTSKPKVANGGIVNKVKATTSRSFGKTTVSGSLAVSADNGPFGYKKAIMGFGTGRIEYALTKNVSAFVNARYSLPLTGNSGRRNVFSFDSGLSFTLAF